MNFQQLLADAKAKADANGDGKLNADDLNALATQHGLDEDMLDSLKAKGDSNGDGKVDLQDIQDAASKFNIHDVAGGVAGAVNDFKDRMFGGDKQ